MRGRCRTSRSCCCWTRSRRIWTPTGARPFYDRITDLPAQTLLTGTGPELFDAFGPRARSLAVTKTDGASAACEAA